MAVAREVRCQNCSHYLGESSVELVSLGTVKHSTEVKVQPPRDLRYCKSCQNISIYVARADLEARLNE